MALVVADADGGQEATSFVMPQSVLRLPSGERMKATADTGMTTQDRREEVERFSLRLEPSQVEFLLPSPFLLLPV